LRNAADWQSYLRRWLIDIPDMRSDAAQYGALSYRRCSPEAAPATFNHRFTQAVEMQLTDEHLRGRTVIAADGQAIGEVSALFIDTSTWMIAALQIKLSKSAAEQLGATRGLLRAATFELPVRLIKSVGDAVLLSIPTLELRQTASEAANGQEGSISS
jgi:sporulation protein YlmC with PRC-barrel domain